MTRLNFSICRPMIFCLNFFLFNQNDPVIEEEVNANHVNGEEEEEPPPLPPPRGESLKPGAGGNPAPSSTPTDPLPPLPVEPPHESSDSCASSEESTPPASPGNGTANRSVNPEIFESMLLFTF